MQITPSSAAAPGDNNSGGGRRRWGPPSAPRLPNRPALHQGHGPELGAHAVPQVALPDHQRLPAAHHLLRLRAARRRRARGGAGEASAAAEDCMAAFACLLPLGSAPGQRGRGGPPRAKYAAELTGAVPLQAAMAAEARSRSPPSSPPPPARLMSCVSAATAPATRACGGGRAREGLRAPPSCPPATGGLSQPPRWGCTSPPRRMPYGPSPRP